MTILIRKPSNKTMQLIKSIWTTLRLCKKPNGYFLRNQGQTPDQSYGQIRKYNSNKYVQYEYPSINKQGFGTRTTKNIFSKKSILQSVMCAKMNITSKTSDQNTNIITLKDKVLKLNTDSNKEDDNTKLHGPGKRRLSQENEIGEAILTIRLKVRFQYINLWESPECVNISMSNISLNFEVNTDYRKLEGNDSTCYANPRALFADIVHQEIKYFKGEDQAEVRFIHKKIALSKNMCYEEINKKNVIVIF